MGSVMSMKTRIFLRTLRFVAYNWWLPFLLGNVSALVGFAFTADLINDAFVSSLSKRWCNHAHGELQGATLSGSERRSSQLRQQVRAAVNQSVLQQQVAATLNALEQHKEQGGKPEKVWSTISNEKGTPWVGDVFGWP